MTPPGLGPVVKAATKRLSGERPGAFQAFAAALTAGVAARHAGARSRAMRLTRIAAVIRYPQPTTASTDAARDDQNKIMARLSGFANED